MAEQRSRSRTSTGAGAARLRSQLARHRAASVTAVMSLLVGLGAGTGSFLLQSHYTTVYDAGHRLSGWQNFLRIGAPWQALVPVLVAGLLATIGAVRLSRAQPEPPVHLGRGEATSAGQLRAAMRVERRVVWLAFMAMSGLTGVVLLRVVIYSILTLTGSSLARSTVVGVAVELGVWILAWASVWNWHRLYLDRMEGWGVLGD